MLISSANDCGCDWSGIQEILNGMDRASGEACVLFMPLLLNELFRVLCTREKSAQRKLAFLGIVHVVQRYRHRPPKSP
jgi:hypothetical protein